MLHALSGDQARRRLAQINYTCVSIVATKWDVELHQLYSLQPAGIESGPIRWLDVEYTLCVGNFAMGDLAQARILY